MSAKSADRGAGTTRIWLADHEGERLVHVFEWYAPRLYMAWSEGALVVARMGGWPRGRKASDEALAFELYRDGKLLRRVSTLDLAGDADNVEASVSHHVVVKTVTGFVDIFHRGPAGTVASVPPHGFEVELIDGRRVIYGTLTGEPVTLTEEMFTRPMMEP